MKKRLFIADNTAADTPLDRLYTRGAAGLSDAELLSLLLPSRDALDRARSLLDGRPLANLLTLPIHVLRDTVGPVAATRIAAGVELSTRITAAALQRGQALTEPGLAGDYMARRLRGLEHEVFVVLFLDSRHRVIAFEELFRGTIDGAEVHPREVVKAALRHNAAAVILGHNHPSGSSEPSPADRGVTARLKQSLALIEVRLLDHFIIGDGAPCSMARLGAI